MRVAELWRYPVKSVQGERVEAGELGPSGLTGDRRYALFDAETGFGLTARRVPDLLFASAALREDGGVRITLPDGSVAEDDDALSAWLGRRVELRASGQVGRPVYENPDDTETEAAESWQPFEGATAAFHDSALAAVTLLSIPNMRGEAARRFRANVILESEGEDELVGSTVHLGGSTLDIRLPVARCVMVTRPQPGGIERDREVLRWIHRERRGHLSVGGTVVQPGTVAVGDEVARSRSGPTSRPRSPRSESP